MSSDQHKTMLSEASGYVPEYSAQAHSGSQELAVHGLSSDEVAKLRIISLPAPCGALCGHTYLRYLTWCLGCAVWL